MTADLFTRLAQRATGGAGVTVLAEPEPEPAWEDEEVAEVASEADAPQIDPAGGAHRPTTADARHDELTTPPTAGTPRGTATRTPAPRRSVTGNSSAESEEQ